MDEITLINAARHSDLNAFNELILLYQDYLFGVAVPILGDDDSAADAVQETLISAFRRLNTFRSESLKPWLTRILVNVCYDMLRHQYRRRAVPLEWRSVDDQEMEPELWMADPAPSPEEDCESHELEHAIVACLRVLPPDFRIVLVLVDVKDYSYEEAAALIGIPLNTVKSRLARARMRMTEELQRFKDQLPARYRLGCSQKVQAGVSLPVCE